MNRLQQAILGDQLRKAQSNEVRSGHKYIKRTGSPGSYQYYYPDQGAPGPAKQSAAAPNKPPSAHQMDALASRAEKAGVILTAREKAGLAMGHQRTHDTLHALIDAHKTAVKAMGQQPAHNARISDRFEVEHGDGHVMLHDRDGKLEPQRFWHDEAGYLKSDNPSPQMGAHMLADAALKRQAKQAPKPPAEPEGRLFRPDRKGTGQGSSAAQAKAAILAAAESGEITDEQKKALLAKLAHGQLSAGQVAAELAKAKASQDD